jgi:hypothetical protein
MPIINLLCLFEKHFSDCLAYSPLELLTGLIDDEQNDAWLMNV